MMKTKKNVLRNDVSGDCELFGKWRWLTQMRLTFNFRSSFLNMKLTTQFYFFLLCVCVCVCFPVYQMIAEPRRTKRNEKERTEEEDEDEEEEEPVVFSYRIECKSMSIVNSSVLFWWLGYLNQPVTMGDPVECYFTRISNLVNVNRASRGWWCNWRYFINSSCKFETWHSVGLWRASNQNKQGRFQQQI